METLDKAARAIRTECRAWIEGLLRLLPYSFLGNYLRSRYWTWRIKAPRPITVYPGVSLLGVETLSVGSRVSVNTNTIINAIDGRIRIGNNVLIGPNVFIRAADHVFNDPDRLIWDQGHKGGEIIIGDDCWIGAGAIILKGVCVGNGCVIGAGAVVTRDIPPGSIAVGVPARVTARRDEKNHDHGDARVSH